MADLFGFNWRTCTLFCLCKCHCHSVIITLVTVGQFFYNLWYKKKKHYYITELTFTGLCLTDNYQATLTNLIFCSRKYASLPAKKQANNLKRCFYLCRVWWRCGSESPWWLSLSVQSLEYAGEQTQCCTSWRIFRPTASLPLQFPLLTRPSCSIRPSTRLHMLW